MSAYYTGDNTIFFLFFWGGWEGVAVVQRSAITTVIKRSLKAAGNLCSIHAFVS